MRKKKVAIFYPMDIEAIDGGGGIRYINNILKSLKLVKTTESFQFNLLGISDKITVNKNENKIAISTKPGFSYGFSIFKYSLLNELNIAHIHRYFHLIPLIPSVIFKNVKIIFTIHGQIPGNTISNINKNSLDNLILKILFKIYLNILFKFVDRFVYVSKATKDYFARNYISFKKDQLYQEKNTILLAAIVPIDERNNNNNMDNKLVKYRDLFKKRFVISVVARLHPVKNHLLILETFKKYKDLFEQKNFVFVFAGAGSLENIIKDFIHKEKLEKMVIMPGNINDKELLFLYKNTNLSLITSFSEGGPISFYESIFSRVPVISTRVGDCPKYIKKYNLGIICESYSPTILSKCLLRGFEGLDEIKEKQIKNIKEEKSLYKLGKNYLSIYNGLFN